MRVTHLSRCTPQHDCVAHVMHTSCGHDPNSCAQYMDLIHTVNPYSARPRQLLV
jgi:hypothetical protein